jgi:hypothetical protein
MRIPLSSARAPVTVLACLVAALPATPQGSWVEEETFVPKTGAEPLLRSGQSVAVSGNTAVVGGPGENALIVDHGKAHVFVHSGTVWVEQAVLTASNGGQGWFSDQFGHAVSIDGDTIVVGAPDQDLTVSMVETGQAYVYVRTGTTWVEETQLISSDPDPDEFFGTSVAVSGDTILAGTPYEDGTFNEDGAVYVYVRTASDWCEQAVLSGSLVADGAHFGQSVAIEGDTAVVGAPAEANSAGRAYVFGRNGGVWTERAVLSAVGGTPGNLFGASVALDGERLVVGAPGQGNGAAYVYRRFGSSWSERAQLTASDPDPADGFGGAVSLDLDRVLVGAALDDVGGVVDAGSAYAFQRSGTVWVQDEKIVAGSSTAGEFGTAVALAGSAAWIGAPLHDEGLPLDSVKGLAPAPGVAAQALAHGTGTLAELDGATAGSTVLANFGPSAVKSLAYDAGSNTLYGVDVASDQLLVLDVASGGVTAVGPVGFDRVQGLAFAPNSGVLYGVDLPTNQLITIDTATGAGSAVGPLGVVGFRSLAYDSNFNTLYGTGGSQAQFLCTIDLTSGAATIWKNTYLAVEALAYDPIDYLLYMVDVTTGRLYYIDPFQNSQPKLVGTVGFQEEAGLVHVLERTLSTPEPYCTAGTSSSGCLALLSAVGTASATAASGFDLTASGVEGAKGGLFFFGTNGRQLTTWGNGTSHQCVVPPVKRTGQLIATGTSGLCDGSYSQDLNTLWTASPAKNPGVGALVQAQLWYRDPFNTSNQTTSLSDAIEFQVGP